MLLHALWVSDSAELATATVQEAEAVSKAGLRGGEGLERGGGRRGQ